MIKNILISTTVNTVWEIFIYFLLLFCISKSASCLAQCVLVLCLHPLAPFHFSLLVQKLHKTTGGNR